MKPAPCSICQLVFDRDELNSCGCGKLICPTCPSTACCLPNAGPERALCIRIRSAALELAPLRTTTSFLGVDGLSPEEQSRFHLLTAVLASLREEWVQFDEQQEALGLKDFQK